MKPAKKVLVLGLGRFGTALVNMLWDNGAQVLVIDHDGDTIDEIKDRTHAAFVGDATDPAVLDAIDASQVDAAVVAFGEAFEAGVLCVSALAKLEIPEIVARAADERKAEVLRAVGATRVPQIETEMGHRMATELMAPVAADLLDFASQYRVVPWTATGKLVGQSLSQANIRQEYEINVLGIRPREQPSSGDKPKLQPPLPSYEIQEGDTLLIVGEEENVTRFVDEA